MPPVDHLRQETKVLPVKNHCEMVSKQFLAACYTPAYPGNRQIKREKKPREMKNTNTSLYENEIADKYTRIDPTIEDKLIIKNIHTESVAKTIEQHQPNKVLHRRPPEISTKEKDLSWIERVELARLRLGYSRKLNNYPARIDDEIQDRCPSCNISPHNTEHLFNCNKNITSLKPIDLWARLLLAAEFFNIDNP